MEIRYGIDATPKQMGWSKFIATSFQQILAIIAATILVPLVVTQQSNNMIVMSPAAALIGAGLGTLVYQLFVRRRSPVFLGSSFAFLGAMIAAAQAGYGFWGLIIGVAFAALVYVVIAVVIHFVGSKWVNRIMQPAIIGATVALIGLSLSGTATDWAMHNGGSDYNLISIVCALVTFIVIVLSATKGNKTMKLIPFIIGIGAGYLLAGIFTAFGHIFHVDYLKVLDISIFTNIYGAEFSYRWFVDLPQLTIVEAIKGGFNLNGADIGSIALMFAPIALVVFAEHIADHKNLSTIIKKDLITDPGLTRTLLGDGIGSFVGAVFGGCANTTYGESIGCVAITGNASTWSIVGASIGCVAIAFLTPLVTIINAIPKSVMGGACIALYGFIAVSGLNMLRKVDLTENRNLFVVSAILVSGIGGLVLTFGKVQITSIAVALLLGILTNWILGGFSKANCEKAEKQASQLIADENTEGADSQE